VSRGRDTSPLLSLNDDWYVIKFPTGAEVISDVDCVAIARPD